MSETNFARWQRRTGLTVNARAARVLGVTPQAVGLWASGKRSCDAPLLALMRCLAKNSDLVAELERDDVAAGGPFERLMWVLLQDPSLIPEIIAQSRGRR